MTIRIAVTGANGFVGRAVVRRLSELGHEVVALVRNDGSEVEGAHQTVAIGDLGRIAADDARLGGALEGCAAVVHLAAWVHRMGVDGLEALDEARRVNVDGTRALARAAIAAGARRFVYMSSIKVMGEERETAFSESDTPSPAGAYAQTKLDAEALLFDLDAQGLLDVTVLRPPLVYGPGVRANFLSLLRFVARFGAWPFGAMTNRRSLIYVGNLADTVVAALKAEATRGRAYLVADAEAVSTAELMQRIARAMGRRWVALPLSGRLVRHAAKLAGRDETARRLFGSMIVNTSMFARDAAYSPRFSMDEGLRMTVDWFISTKP